VSQAAGLTCPAVGGMRERDVARIIPMHCSGLPPRAFRDALSGAASSSPVRDHRRIPS